MFPKLSRYALILLAIVVMGTYLPQIYRMIFDKTIGKTQLFFSPVIKKFVFPLHLAIIMFTGLYGLIAVIIIEPEA